MTHNTPHHDTAHKQHEQHEQHEQYERRERNKRTSDTRPVGLVPKRWRCCHCGSTGVDSYGQTCPHCEGLGFC